MRYAAWWAILWAGRARSNPFDVGAVPLLFEPRATPAVVKTATARNCSSIQRIAPWCAALPAPHYACVQHPNIHPLLLGIVGGTNHRLLLFY